MKLMIVLEVAGLTSTQCQNPTEVANNLIAGARDGLKYNYYDASLGDAIEAQWVRAEGWEPFNRESTR